MDHSDDGKRLAAAVAIDDDVPVAPRRASIAGASNRRQPRGTDMVGLLMQDG